MDKSGPGFVSTRSLGRDGTIVTTVTHGGVECKSYELHSPIARSFVGFSHILDDLANCRAWMHHLHSITSEIPLDPYVPGREYVEASEDEAVVPKALYYATIITYGKCFVRAEGGRRVLLNPRDYVEDTFRGLHYQIMESRHGLVAHALGVFDGGTALCSVSPDGRHVHIHATNWRLAFQDDRHVSPNFLQLIEHVEAKVAVKVRQLLAKLSEEVRRTGPETFVP